MLHSGLVFPGKNWQMRRPLLAITGLILALVVGLLLALRSESFVLGAARWAVGAFTDLRLELRNPSVDFYRGELSADEIHLMPAAGEGPALLSVLEFSARLSMPTLSGANPARSFLRASAVMVYLSDSDETAEPAPMQWLGYLRWLPSELRIGQVHLIGASTDTWIFPLKHLHGQQLDSRSYRLGADADYEGEPLGVTVDVLAVDKGWGVTAAETKIKLSAPESGSEITLAGTLEGTEDDFIYNFALDAFYRDIREFLKGFEKRDKLAGELRMQGTLAGDTSGFVLSNATFLLDNFPDYGFQASGSLEYALSGKSSIALVADGELASLAHLVDWIDLDVSDFGRARSSIRLSGSLDKPVVDAFRLTTSSAAGLTVTMSGQLNLFEVDTDSGPGANAIAVDMQGPSLAVLEHWLGKLPYDPGPWQASGQLTGNQTDLALQDIVLEMGTPGSIEIRATGALGRIGLPQGTQEKITVDGIGLSLRAHAPDSAGLATLLGRDDIPPYHELEASLSVNGSAQELQLSDGHLTVTASDMVARIGPLTAMLRPAEGAPLSGLAGPVVIDFSDTAALSQYTSGPMPVLGPLKITARLAQKGEVFQLLDMLGTVREGNLAIEFRGLIGNLAAFSDVSLISKIGGLDTRTVLATLLPDFSYAAPLGTLGGSFKLVEKQHSWTLSKLALTAGDDTTPLAFSLDGEVRDLTGLVTADLDSQFRLDDPALLESLSGLALKPVSGSLALTTTAEDIHGTLKAQVGDTHIQGDARVAIAGKQIQGVHLRLATPELLLQDFGLGPAPEGDAREGDPQESVAKAGAPEDTTAAPQGTVKLLAQLREKSPPFPVDLTLKIDGITGDSSNIDSLQVKVSGIDNRYTLEQFSANYNQALAEVRGIIDLNPTPPAMSLAGQANALPLSAILRDVGISSNVTGALTILGGVTVMGDTTEALIGSLNGSVALALENAVIDGAAYDLLATDLLAWIYSGALTEKSTHLACTMAKFQLRQGVATTESLYIESAKMVATGTAKFDLVKQRMDLRITPLSKSRLLQVPSEVRLKGDMSNPKAEISTISAVADATSSALMLIPSLTLKLFGVNPSSSKTYRPCQANLGN
jgi:hypothetical protein